MKLTLLGTGTSQGVPIIGCDCMVCRSENPKDKRLRSSALLKVGEVHILIDAGPDFRQQMLRAGVQHLDAILLTHEHNDHVIGLDDVRPLNYQSGKAIAVYAQERVAEEVKKRFAYVFGEYIPGLPQLQLHHIDSDSLFSIKEMPVQAIGIWHGKLPILGYRFGDICYLTDVKSVDPEEFIKIKGVRYLVVNALQITPHPTHFNLEEALDFIARVGPEKAWITHLSHHMGDISAAEKLLPANVHFGFDGLEIEIE